MSVLSNSVGKCCMAKLFLEASVRGAPMLGVIACIGVASAPVPVQAELVCIELTAEVAYVDDRDGFLEGAIAVGDVVSGTYTYESTTLDTNSLPTVGDYWHLDDPSFGITLTSGETVFRSDPDNVKFLVEIVNDHGVPPRDNYLLRSYNNIFDVSAGSDNHISWQLDDPTATAISSDELPIVAPNLADWDSIFGLTITSENLENWNSFFIRAHVTSSNLCEEPPPQLWVVCHKPETQAERTLFVSSEKAVEAHLNHGDVLGECP